MNYNELKTADLRLAMLQILEEDAGYSVNEYLMDKCLALLGHAISQDKLRTEAAWLEEQNLLTVTPTSPLTLTITGRGADPEDPGRIPRPGGRSGSDHGAGPGALGVTEGGF